MKERKFTKIFNDSMIVASVHQIGGDTLELDIYHKVLHQYMLGQFQYYKQHENSYYESQATIATQFNIAERTVSRKISDLVKVGLIEITKEDAKSGYKKNVYIVHDFYKRGFILLGADGKKLTKTDAVSKDKTTVDKPAVESENYPY